MASKHFVVLLILVVGAKITGATMPVTFPIQNVTDAKIQNMGSFAVEAYNKQGKSHLLFKKVFGGYVFFYPPATGVTFYLELMATNCSQSGAVGNYTAEVFDLTLNGNTTLYFYGLKPKKT